MGNSRSDALDRKSLGNGLFGIRGDVSPEAAAEAELVERAKTSRQAFGELYERYYSRILNYIYRCTLNVAVAEELTSNTFFKALQGLSRYRHRGVFAAWLYRIATNEVRMHWRVENKRRARERNPQWLDDLERVYFAPQARESAEQRRERMSRYARLHEALRKLPQRYQTVLVLRFFEELSYDEIAKVAGKRLGTVKSLIHRGLKRLRGLMTPDATSRDGEHWEQ